VPTAFALTLTLSRREKGLLEADSICPHPNLLPKGDGMVFGISRHILKNSLIQFPSRIVLKEKISLLLIFSGLQYINNQLKLIRFHHESAKGRKHEMIRFPLENCMFIY
jgi:hypothetical protein